MRFIIYGAGGVGCIIGACLFVHGHETVLVGNAAHVDRIKEDGLKFIAPGKTQTLRIPAAKTAEEIAPFVEGDVVLLTAKSQHTLRCLGQMKGAGAPTGLPLFCFQNSIWNEPTAIRIFDNVYGAVVSLPATFLRPGEVETPLEGVMGHVEVGRYPSGVDELSSRVVSCLAESDLDAVINEKVMKTKGAKCLQNLMNAFDAITNAKAPDDFAVKVRGEAEQIWRTAGIDWEPVEEYAKRSRRRLYSPTSRAGKMSSTWQSLSRATGNVEAEEINGDVVRIGKLLGIEAPYNECLWRVSARMAEKREKPGKYSLSDLEKMVAGRSWSTS
jgi:2-dehydropantoate 2-reductase